MSLKPIPKPWREAVSAALRSGSPQRIQFTESGRREWQNDFPAAFRYELEEALIRRFSEAEVLGCSASMDRPPGETWEFYFTFNEEKTYGKILLRLDKKKIVIFSAHRPRKKRLRCE